MQTIPQRPFIERRGDRQIVNFDIVLRNSQPVPYELVAVKLTVRDSSGAVELMREINRNGHPPALDAIGPRLLSPGGIVDLFAPFDNFDSWMRLDRIRYDLLFMKPGHHALPVPFSADLTAHIEVRPRMYNPPLECLPLAGPLLVHDGHDFYSHHRRLNIVRAARIASTQAVNPNLYALDLMAIDAAGKLYHGSPTKPQNWMTYGRPVRAPEAGTVVSAVSNIPENTFGPAGDSISPAGARDPNGTGNYVTIRHFDGRVSWLLHMQPGSVTVKSGQEVEAGRIVGKIGFSGDSLFPHLHYNVTDGSRYPAQGVPTYFRYFDRIIGKQRRPEQIGQIDTGDLIQSWPNACRYSDGARRVRASRLARCDKLPVFPEGAAKVLPSPASVSRRVTAPRSRFAGRAIAGGAQN